ncbi:hypothetical protein [Streptomyces sp. 3211]|uniref:hypothetical protein n=1 Tax=Streptomyces sp. 3211 TaxID=1964449 RepID=UPI001331310C|nr:hypothetical protein [Streptomyces sp. 3211]
MVVAHGYVSSAVRVVRGVRAVRAVRAVLGVRQGRAGDSAPPAWFAGRGRRAGGSAAFSLAGV